MKRSPLILIVFAYLAAIPVLGFAQSSTTELQPLSVQFDHITYLTNNIDSLVRHFTKRGFRVVPGVKVLNDVERYYIWFPNSTYIELQATTTHDTSDWRIQALKKYGNHICTLAFRIDSLDHVRSIICDSILPCGAMLDHSIKIEIASDSLEIPEAHASAFGLESAGPLEVTFIQYDSTFKQLHHSLFTLDVPQHENQNYKIDWLLLSATPALEAKLRTLFMRLLFQQFHEGCCDYWMMGPGDNRLRMRFEPIANATEDRLSIEELGVIMAY